MRRTFAVTHGVPTSGVIGNELAGSAGMTETLCIVWEQLVEGWTWRMECPRKNRCTPFKYFLALFSPPAFSVEPLLTSPLSLVTNIILMCIYDHSSV